MNKYKWIIILLNLGGLLIYFNCSVVKKEAIMEDGQLILLELAPVDPRSLMQGDYMRLNYAISRVDWHDEIPARGFCVVRLDSDGVAEKVRLQPKRTPINEGEYIIEFTKAKWMDIHIGAESFFFQEGHAEKYEQAKYGGVKVDKNGNSVLIGLYDENRRRIN